MVVEGITGDMTGLGIGIMFLYGAIAFVILYVIISAFSTRRTQDYRKELTDMYVAGIIKQIATRDKVDLEVEYEAFKKWRKLRRRERQDIDEAIESELKEKVTDEMNKKEKKI